MLRLHFTGAGFGALAVTLAFFGTINLLGRVRIAGFPNGRQPTGNAAKVMRKRSVTAALASARLDEQHLPKRSGARFPSPWRRQSIERSLPRPDSIDVEPVGEGTATKDAIKTRRWNCRYVYCDKSQYRYRLIAG